MSTHLPHFNTIKNIRIRQNEALVALATCLKEHNLSLQAVRRPDGTVCLNVNHHLGENYDTRITYDMDDEPITIFGSAGKCSEDESIVFPVQLLLFEDDEQ